MTHASRQRRRDGFGQGADAYERARPSYPAEAVACIVGRAGLGPGRRVLDLAAGTGKLTRLLVPSGADVVAVEPVAAMRDQLRSALPDLEILDGTAEDIPLGDASVDAVTVAQAFHWFDPRVALAEIAPGAAARAARWCWSWNTRDRSVDWVRAFGDALDTGGDRPYDSYYEVDYPAVRGRRTVPVRFEPVEQWSCQWVQPFTPELLVARAASVSVVAALPEPEREPGPRAGASTWPRPIPTSPAGRPSRSRTRPASSGVARSDRSTGPTDPIGPPRSPAPATTCSAGGRRSDGTCRGGRTRDPWAVLVSELMLQQTQVARVEPRWHRFLARFPTPAVCAAAGLGAVVEEWAGLGYNRRAVDLHRCAVAVVERARWPLPDELDALLVLPGIGPYTARAVLAFAFERDVAVVDTNVGRILARTAGRSFGARAAQEQADALVPAGRGLGLEPGDARSRGDRVHQAGAELRPLPGRGEL